MNRSDYIKEGVRQLSDTAFYQKLHQDPPWVITREK